ncbi:MAG: BrnT family toxin [Albidovulum sp.]
MYIKYDWDEHKRLATLTLRGVDFADMMRFDWTSAVVVTDDRADYGETRLQAMGLIDGRLHAAIVTPRGPKLRIISLRKANARERTQWERR